MEILEKLTNNIHRASDELISLKKERQQLLSEMEFLRQQLQQLPTLARENERLKRDQDRLKTKLQRMQKKVERLLSLDLSIMTPFGGSSNHEKHVE